MAFYTDPEAMYRARAARFKREGDFHWAMAKQGQGGHHYGQARLCYAQVAQNTAKGDLARDNHATWKKRI